MSHLVTSTPFLAGAHAVRPYGGLGVRGSDIPTGGEAGASPVANDGITGDAEYRWALVSGPSAGVLTLYDDCSFTFSGAPTGTYSFTYRLFEDGVDRGTAVVSLTVEAAGQVISGTSVQMIGAIAQLAVGQVKKLVIGMGASVVGVVQQIAIGKVAPALHEVKAQGTTAVGAIQQNAFGHVVAPANNVHGSGAQSVTVVQQWSAGTVRPRIDDIDVMPVTTAADMLAKYMAAEAAVLEGKSIQFNGRVHTMADLADIRTGRREWEGRVNAQRARAAGVRTIGGLGYSVARFD